MAAPLPRRIHPNLPMGEDYEFRSKWEFMILMSGYAIGLVNIWRFPYLCATYGGAVFFFGYLIATVLIAGPLLLYEVLLGQYHQGGPNEVMEKLAPRLVSIADVQWFMVFVVTLYSPTIVGYAVNYMEASIWPYDFGHGLPWFKPNMTAHKYWEEIILDRSDGIDGEGWWHLSWRAAAGHSYAWFYVWMTLRNGVEGISKLASSSLCVCCVLLLIFVVMSLTQPGAWAGVAYLFEPDMSELKGMRWGMSISQALFALSPAMGPGMVFGSCNPWDHPLVKDVIMITVGSILFSLFSSVLVFAILGCLAQGSFEGIQALSKDGMGIVFVSMTNGVGHFPAQRLCAFLFFMMLTSLGADTLMPWAETVFLPFIEMGAARGMSRKTVIPICCVVMWVLGLPFSLRNGSYLMELFDHFVPTYVLLFCAFVEYAMMLKYGFKRIFSHLHIIQGIQIPNCMVFQAWLSLVAIFVAAITMLYSDIRLYRCAGDSINSTACSDASSVEEKMSYNLIFGWTAVIAPLLYFLSRVVACPHRSDHFRT